MIGKMLIWRKTRAQFYRETKKEQGGFRGTWDWGFYFRRCFFVVHTCQLGGGGLWFRFPFSFFSLRPVSCSLVLSVSGNEEEEEEDA